MLKFLSKRKRSRKVLLIAFVGLLAVGLITFFGPGLKRDVVAGSGGNDTVIAKVAKYEITLRELNDGLTAFGQQMAMGQGSTRMEDAATLYPQYGKLVLDKLISEKLIQYEAEQRNIGATDHEVQEKLKTIPGFSPWPGPEAYRARLQQFRPGLTPARFEDDLRSEISREKLRSYITAPIQVPEKEVEDEYRRNHTDYSVRWVELTADKFRDQVTVNDAALAEFFQQHKDDFKVTTEERRARYIFIDPKKAAEGVQISDDDLKKSFSPERNIQQVRVSQIVLDIPKPKVEPSKDAAKDSKKAAGKDAKDTKKDTPAAVAKDQTPEDKEEEVRKKAEDLAKRAQGAAGKPGEDFAELARKNSEDAKSKAGGGDIGWVTKKEKPETDDPLTRVFSMQKDEVSQPTKKGDKFYIFKVTDRKMPTFEQSRDQLLKDARKQKGYTRAIEIGNEAEQKFKESKNAEAVVAEINKANGAGVASVKETPFFAVGDVLPELGAASEVESAIFALDNTGEIADRVNLAEGGEAIAQYTERRDPHDPTFDEARTKVEDRYRADRARELAAERARQLCQAKTADALKAAAISMKLKPDERAGLTGEGTIGPLISEANRAPIYKLNVNEVTREPIKVADSDNYVVAAMISRKDADMAGEFQKTRKSIVESLEGGRRESFFAAYLASVKKRLETDGQIKVYQDVIDKAMQVTSGAGALPTMPRTPGFPGSGGNPRRRGPRQPQIPQQ